MRDLRISREPVLGTRLDVWARGGRRALRDIEAVLLDEITRLERIYSVFLPSSELCRWRECGGDAHRPGPELTRLLEEGLRWHAVSGGAFNPSVGFISERWRCAQNEGIVPDDGELDALAVAAQSLPYRREGERFAHSADCRSLNFNALAKGLIVDLATQHTLDRCRPAELLVNVGGDLRHAGAGRVRVGIEDPHRAYDNVAPCDSVELANQGLATSGGTRRGFSIGSRWFSHVIDPRTARPVEQVLSASVIAPTTAQADVVATVLSVLAPHEGLLFASALPGVACLLVEADRTRWASESWTPAS